LTWIDRLFGKKESSWPEIRIADLLAWLAGREQKISEGIARHASSLYSEIKEALSEIKESTALLEEAIPEGRFHLKMVKIAVSNRDNMARQVRMLLENITIPQAADVRSVVVFHENALQTLTVCLENMMKSYQYTKLVFLEESKRVIADVNALGRLINQLIEPINNQKTVLDAIEKARGLLKNIKDATSDIELWEKVINEDGAKFALLKKDIDEKQKVLTFLRESDSYKQYTAYMDELILLENNAGKKEDEIKGIISPLNKALGRLKQLSDSGRYTLKPQIKEWCNLCLSDPVNVTPEFFVEFQNIVASGVLNLTPERTDKILEQTKYVISSLGSYKEEYQALVRDIGNKKNEISGMKISKEETDLEKEISTLQEKLTALEKELEMSKNNVLALKNNVELKRQELAKSVSVIDDRIRIV